MANPSSRPSRPVSSNTKTNDSISYGIYTENTTISAVANPRSSHDLDGGLSRDEGTYGMASVVVGNSTSSGPSALDEYRIESVQSTSTDNTHETVRIAVNAPASDSEIFVSQPNQTVLEVAKEASDAYPSLNRAIGGGLSILKQFEEKLSKSNNIKKVILRIEELLESLSENWDETEKTRMIALKKKLDEPFRMLDLMNRQGRLSTLFKNSEKTGEMSGIVKDIDDAITNYQTVLQQSIYQTVVESGHSTAALRQDVQQGIQDIQQGIQTSGELLQASGDIMWLDRLPHAMDAAYSAGDRNGCLDTTRMELLQAIEAWVDDPDELPVYWLNGLAGTGKSTVAQTIAERTLAKGIFGGSFFCFQGSTDRSNLNSIFPTLAYQLACLSHKFRAILIDVIKADPTVGHSSLSNQLEKLLVGPLKKTNLKTLIIVDALDECVDNKPESAFLRLLSQHIHMLPSVKFFITGRPEEQIDAGFQLPSLRSQTEIRLLHEMDPTTVDRDLVTFFKENFSQLVQSPRGHRWKIDNDWPGPDAILDLVRKSGGLFIYANTTFRFINSGFEDPRKLLHLIVNLQDGSANEALLPVDTVYNEILKGALAKVKSAKVSLARASGIFQLFRLVVGSIVMLFDPLSADTLAPLLNVEASAIRISLLHLSSLMVVPDEHSDRPIRILHKSFPDYITDQARCEDETFYVNPTTHHAHMVLFCLGLMKKQLKRNICNLPRYVMNSEVEDLSERRRQYIGDALEYACKNWTKHLKMARTANSDLITKIVASVTEFFKFRSLPWLEICSNIGKLTLAVYAFQDIEQWLSTVNDDTQYLGNLVVDCKRFLLHFFDPIQESSQHIYHSALPWCPANSLIRTLYGQELLSEVKVVIGIDNSWDSCVRTISAGGPINRLAISPRGDLIGVGHLFGCQILDAASGSVVTAWKDSSGVYALAFSADASFFAFGKGRGQIGIYDVQTGQIMWLHFSEAKGVRSMSFAPKGMLLAFGSEDGVVRIWDVGSETSPRLTLREHTESVESVCWSPDGSLVASGSRDGSMKMWDASTGICLHTTEVEGEINSIAWSPDGSKIAVSTRGWVRIYGAPNYDLLVSFQVHAGAGIAFSPKGDHLVYPPGKSIVVRDLTRDVDVATFVKHTGRVTDVAFSPNGTSVISGGIDCLVRIWAFGPRIGETGFHRDPDRTTASHAVTFSPNERLMATTTRNEEVKLWDTKTWSHIDSLFLDPQRVAGYPVLSFSPDSSLIACGSRYSMWIWDVDTRAVISDLHGAEFASFCFSPDGGWIVTCGSRVIQLWDVRKADLIAEFTWTENINGDEMAFFGDGSGIQITPRIMLDIIPSTSPGQSMPFELIVSSHEKPLLYRGPALYKLRNDWVVDTNNRRVCWIPPDSNYAIYDWDGCGEIFALCSPKGLVLLEFSNACADVDTYIDRK